MTIYTVSWVLPNGSTQSRSFSTSEAAQEFYDAIVAAASLVGISIQPSIQEGMLG